MLINDIDTSIYFTTVASKHIGNSSIETTQEWLRHALVPNLINQDVRYIPVDFTLLIHQEPQDTLLKVVSMFIKELKKCTIKFDDLPFYFDGVLDTYETIMINKYICQLNVTLRCHSKYLQATQATNFPHCSRIEIPYDGNMDSPLNLNITYNPDSTVVPGAPGFPLITSLTIRTKIGQKSGYRDVFDELVTYGTMTLHNMHKYQTVNLNGETYTCKENGQNKFKDLEGDFPYIMAIPPFKATKPITIVLDLTSDDASIPSQPDYMPCTSCIIDVNYKEKYL